MPKINENNEEEVGKNAPLRSARRDSRRPKGRGQERRITVRSVHRDEPDLRKLARAVIQLAVAQVEAEAQAQAQAQAAKRSPHQEDADES